jgi:putative transposase
LFFGMARSPRIEYPNAVYHILARGNRREAIVFSDKDRQLFIDTLGGLCVKHGWEIWGQSKTLDIRVL